MELHHLNAFVVAAEELHFSRAARRLYMSQSALSRSIRALEGEMGVVLFERSTRHVALTQAGDRFLREARLALGQVNIAVKAAQSVGSTRPTVLRVGYSEATEAVLADALRLFRSECPDVTLALREVDRSGPGGAEPSGKWDVALCWQPPGGPDTVTLRLSDEPLWVSLPADHPLAKGAAVSLDELGDTEPLLLPTGLLDHVREAWPGRPGHDPGGNPAHDVPAFAAAAMLVSAGLGVTIAPRSACTRLGLPGTVFLPLADRALSLPLYIARRRGTPSMQVTALVRALRRSARSLTDRSPINAADEYLSCGICNTDSAFSACTEGIMNRRTNRGGHVSASASDPQTETGAYGRSDGCPGHCSSAPWSLHY